jgi:1-deoxy-D-xylulose-5-phosphate synthase
MAVEAAKRLAHQGIAVTVVDPRWVLPVPATLTDLAREHKLVVTVEDGGRSGGVGAAVADVLAPQGVPVRVLALPQQFLPAGSRNGLLEEFGLTAQTVSRGVTELVAALGTGPAQKDTFVPGSAPAD